MGFLKKQSAGFYLTVLTIIFGLLGIIYYCINCNTSYFMNLGMDMGLMICAVIGVALEILFIGASQFMGEKRILDVIPVLCGVLFMAAFVIFVSIRINSIATILSFERNDQTMADLKSAILGMGFCFAAVVFNMTASFFRVVKEEKRETI